MLNREKHRFIMFQILKEIFESSIGKYIAFKGGTACYFFHELDRFSTDLDFDVLSDTNIDTDVGNILKKYGSIKAGNKLILSYGENDINIKIDLSRKVWKSNRYEVKNFYGTDIRVQEKSTIFANKLVAMNERTANRDFYDVWFFSKHAFEINEELIQERTGKKIDIFLSDTLEHIKKLPKNYNILDGLGEVLDEKQKFFVKNKLLSELIHLLEFKIDFFK